MGSLNPLYVSRKVKRKKKGVREHQSKKSEFSINMPLLTVYPMFVIITSKPLPQVMSRGSCIKTTSFQQVTRLLSFGAGFPSFRPRPATRQSEHPPGILCSGSASIHLAKCLSLCLQASRFPTTLTMKMHFQ